MDERSARKKRQADDLGKRLESHLKIHPEALDSSLLGDLGPLLQASEALLISLMNGDQPPYNSPGTIELGLVLYWLNTDHSWLATLLQLPATTITPAMLAGWNPTFSNQGAVFADGTLVGDSQYMAFDAGWLLAAMSCLAVNLGYISIAPFATNPATVTVPSTSTVTIALTGDWGTGAWSDGNLTCPSQQVVGQITSLAPDFTIHLGDVYYLGSSGEESDNFLQPWYAGSQGTFALNANHDMYDGANGYFNTTLASPTFADQQGTSYFAIDGGSWILIGLDSAYYAPDPFYMTGAVTDTNQITFLKNLDLTGKTVIVVTHHNALCLDGSTTESLWGNVTTALGQDPDYWYWGHIHNGIIYSNQSAAGATTSARCVGHGALPFGSGYQIQSSGVTYFANSPLSDAFSDTTPQQQNRVLNGFALLTVGPSGVTEQLYDQTGTVVWPPS